MKKPTLFSFFLMLSAPAFAAAPQDLLDNALASPTIAASAASNDPRPVLINQSGRSFGSCDSITFSTCSEFLSQDARRDGERNVRFACESVHGQLQSSPFCTTFCNPMSPPPYPASPVFVNCDASCHATCLE